MIPIQSNIDGKELPVGELKKKLGPLGFNVNGQWEYDHAYIDYKLNDDDGDRQYVRIPFKSTGGLLDDDGTFVQIGTPFLLDHQFQTDVDEEGNIGALTGSFDQFKSPADKDAPFPKGLVEEGKTLVNKAERALGTL
ncbi:YugN family protein [Mesobacillus sp.]|uniref:YugN family protein n=1 Tax=Mesobacillus sp. TaxID=2675271 RepID=UPI0039F01A09